MGRVGLKFSVIGLGWDLKTKQTSARVENFTLGNECRGTCNNVKTGKRFLAEFRDETSPASRQNIRKIYDIIIITITTIMVYGIGRYAKRVRE